MKHQVDDLKPCLERIVRILKTRLGKDRETITVPSAACFGLADPGNGRAFSAYTLSSLQRGHFTPLSQRRSCKKSLLASSVEKQFMVSESVNFGFMVWPP